MICFKHRMSRIERSWVAGSGEHASAVLITDLSLLPDLHHESPALPPTSSPSQRP